MDVMEKQQSQERKRKMETYEVLEDIRCLKKETIKLVGTLKNWLTDKELDQYSKLVKTFQVMVSRYEEECLDEGICPNCGGEILTKTIYDREVGKYTVVKCMDCQTNFD